MTTETTLSVSGNRSWLDQVLVETVGRVIVSTCRPWSSLPGDIEQEPYYQTLLIWSPVINDRRALIVDHYDDERLARWGHRRWEIPEVLAETLALLAADEFEEQHW